MLSPSLTQACSKTSRGCIVCELAVEPECVLGFGYTMIRPCGRQQLFWRRPPPNTIAISINSMLQLSPAVLHTLGPNMFTCKTCSCGMNVQIWCLMGISMQLPMSPADLWNVNALDKCKSKWSGNCFCNILGRGYWAHLTRIELQHVCWKTQQRKHWLAWC